MTHSEYDAHAALADVPGSSAELIEAEEMDAARALFGLKPEAVDAYDKRLRQQRAALRFA